MSSNIPPISLSQVDFSYQDSASPVFSGLNFDFPGGVTSLVGQNGTGKTTLLLLGGGRLRPSAGSVIVSGKNLSEVTNEEELNRLVSFIFQNMEFDTDDAVGKLMQFVYENGFYENKDVDLVSIISKNLDIKDVLHKKLQETSKGQMQRIIIAFSLLYGSKIIIMDEPIFALEEKQKEQTLEFLHSFATEKKIPLYYSIHELDLSKKYSDNCILFSKEGKLISGPIKEIMTRERVEEAYQVPLDMLKQKESLYRDRLSNIDKSLYE